MSIVKMKKLSLIADAGSKKSLIARLMSLGCVEISDAQAMLAEPSLAGCVSRDVQSTETYDDRLSGVKEAITVLDKYAKQKSPMFAPRRQITQSEFFSDKVLSETSAEAEKINALYSEINRLTTEKQQLSNKIAALTPWLPLDVALDVHDGLRYCVILGTCPAQADFDTIDSAVKSQIEGVTLSLVSSDREQHYIFSICHKDCDEELLQLLKGFGFSKASFKTEKGTAKDAISSAEQEIKNAEKEVSRLEKEIAEHKDSKKLLEQSCDSLAVMTLQEKTREKLLTTQTAFYLQGWIPAETCGEVSEELERAGAAYSLDDPDKDDDVPVLLHNNKLVKPFGEITNLYGVPSYDSIIDPNPFLAPFFFIFFGMMLSDAGYGIILSLGCLFYLKKVRPTGAMKQFITMFMYCGVSTFVVGGLFGSWFGDAISVISETFFGNRIDIAPWWFNPLEKPMDMLMVSIALGGIHLAFGMGLSAYRMIKRGHVFDAICDIGFWYVLLGGLVMTLVGVSWGIWVALAGGVAILLTGGRDSPKILGKITGGLGALYGITSYLSDALSYSRLLALGLSTGVVAQVINKMGSLGGATVPGVILFIAAFFVGHIFNLAINLLGAFVHSSRLQYIEFFGKFYEGGGRPFRPLEPKTKYVEILKEEI